ncbi:hypothetical protein K7432_002954 [Basidiobolus ranarum]|uniref:Uncharacterized protein n=1 Tax=Basidiobolus ranarum TaxID=34480 RepID=A0ABR2X0R0_9FUNG
MGTHCSWCGIAPSNAHSSSFRTKYSLCLCSYIYGLFKQRSFSILEPLLSQLLCKLNISPSTISNQLNQEILRKEVDYDWYKRVVANLDFRSEVATIQLPLDKKWRRKIIQNLTWINQCIFASTFRISQALESMETLEGIPSKSIETLAIDANRETLENMNSSVSTSRASYIRKLEDIMHKFRGNPLALGYFLGTTHNLALMFMSEPTVAFTRRLKVWLSKEIDALSLSNFLLKPSKDTSQLTLLEMYSIYFESLSTSMSTSKDFRFIRYYLVKLIWLQVINQISHPMEVCNDSIEHILLLAKMHLEKNMRTHNDLYTNPNINPSHHITVKPIYSLLPNEDIEIEYGVTLYLLMSLYVQTCRKEIPYDLIEKCIQFLGAEFYPAYYLLGHIKYHEGYYSEALEYFKKCFTAEKNLRSDSFNMAGCSAVHLSKPNMAVKYFKSSLESNIRSSHPLWNLCVVYERTGKLQVEIKMLTHLTERLTGDLALTSERSHLNGTSPQACISLLNVVSRLGAVYLEQKRFKEAENEYSNIISPIPRQIFTKQTNMDGIMRKVIRDYVYTLLMLDPPKFDRAIDVCNSILEIDPLDISIQLYLAEAIWYKDQTIETAEKAKDIYLRVEKLLLTISKFCVQESCNEEPTMKKAKLEVESYTTNSEIRKCKNRVDIEQLFNEDYRKSLLIQAYNNQAYMLSTLGLVEEAIQVLMKSVVLSSDTLHSIYNLTLLRLRTGKDLEATYGWLDFRGIELKSSAEYYNGLMTEVKIEIDKLSAKDIDSLSPMFNGDKINDHGWNEIDCLSLRYLDQFMLKNACELANSGDQINT